MKVTKISAPLVAALLSRIDQTRQSDSSISQRAGLDRKYLSKLRSRPDDLNLSSFLNLCIAIGLNPVELFGTRTSGRLSTLSTDDGIRSIDVDVGHGSVDELLDRWAASRGRIEAIPTHLLDQLVVFKPPKKSKPVPHALGQKSFTASLLSSPTVRGLSAMIDASDRMLSSRVAESHLAALQGKPVMTIESGQWIWSGGISAQVDYLRLLLPVSDDAGTSYILSFSKQIGAEQQSSHHPDE